MLCGATRFCVRGAVPRDYRHGAHLRFLLFFHFHAFAPKTLKMGRVYPVIYYYACINHHYQNQYTPVSATKSTYQVNLINRSNTTHPNQHVSSRNQAIKINL
jgi:hypothetical protein